MFDLSKITKGQIACVLAALLTLGVAIWFIIRNRKQGFQCGCGAAMSTAPPVVEGIVVAPKTTQEDDILPSEESFQGGCGCSGH